MTLHREFVVCLVCNTGLFSAWNSHQPAANVFRGVRCHGCSQQSVVTDVHHACHCNMEVNCLLEEVTFPCMPLHGSCQMVAENDEVQVARVALLTAVKCLEAAATLWHKAHHDTHQRPVENGADLVVVVVCHKMAE